MAQPKRVAAAAACTCVFTIEISSSSWSVSLTRSAVQNDSTMAGRTCQESGHQFRKIDDYSFGEMSQVLLVFRWETRSHCPFRELPTNR